MSPSGPDLYDRPPYQPEKPPLAATAFAWWLFIAVFAGLSWVISALAGVLF